MNSAENSNNKGQIITFYSYKGGTGRSMVVANVAWTLALTGHRVLVIDWDLEAPGVHRYFDPFLDDKELNSTPGLLDFVEYLAAESAISPSPLDRSRVDIAEYVTALEWPLDLKYGIDWQRFGPRAGIHLMPAGRQSHTYSGRVNSFNWIDFFERLGGRGLLDLVKEQMRSVYDYILIDSRTGVSDTSGICTVEMPDTLALCFTLNKQSITGSFGIANSVRANSAAINLRSTKSRSQSTEIGVDNEALRSLRIFPIPCRVEMSEPDKRTVALSYAQRLFNGFLGHLENKDLSAYWGNVQIAYLPYYAFEEVPAVFRDDPQNTYLIQYHVRQIVSYLTGKPLTSLDPFSSLAIEAQEIRAMVVRWYEKAYPEADLSIRDIRPDPSPETPIATQPTKIAEQGVLLSFSRKDRLAADLIASELLSRGIRAKVFPEKTTFDDAGMERTIFLIGEEGLSATQLRHLAFISDVRNKRAKAGYGLAVLLGEAKSEISQAVLYQSAIVGKSLDRLVIDSIANRLRGSLEPQSLLSLRGSKPYFEEDSLWFRGRESEVEALCEKICAFRTIALSGDSGIGKTSMVLAGVIPALRRRQAPRFEVCYVSLTAAPFRDLASAADVFMGQMETELRVRGNKLAKSVALTEGQLAIKDVIAQMMKRVPPSQTLLLIFDCADCLVFDWKEAIRNRFLRELTVAVEELGAKVLFVSRTEALEMYRTFSPTLLPESISYLEPLRGEEFEASIKLGGYSGADQTTFDSAVQRYRSHPEAMPIVLDWLKRNIVEDNQRETEAAPSFQATLRDCTRRADQYMDRLDPAGRGVVESILKSIVGANKSEADYSKELSAAELSISDMALIRPLIDSRVLCTRSKKGGRTIISFSSSETLGCWARLDSLSAMKKPEENEVELSKDGFDLALSEWIYQLSPPILAIEETRRELSNLGIILDSDMSAGQIQPLREVLRRKLSNRNAELSRILTNLNRLPAFHNKYKSALGEFHLSGSYESSVLLINEPDSSDERRDKLVVQISNLLMRKSFVLRLPKRDRLRYGLAALANLELHLLGSSRAIAIVDEANLPSGTPIAQWGWMRGMGRPVLVLIEQSTSISRETSFDFPIVPFYWHKNFDETLAEPISRWLSLDLILGSRSYTFDDSLGRANPIDVSER